MTLYQRRILYIVFILTFLVATPLISLYATGYKISNGLRVQKTGIFIVDSEPSGANIYLNGKLQQNIIKKYLNQKNSVIITPAKIKNLLPEEYDIVIEKQGYWPWQKKLTINSGEATFAEDIYLFKKNLPLLVIPSSQIISSLTPNSEYIATFSNNEAILYNFLENSSQISALTTTSQSSIASSSAVYWSPDNDKILVQDIIYSTADWDSPREIAGELGQNVELVKWVDSNILSFFRNNTLYYYDLNDKKITALATDISLSDYLITDDYVYFTRQTLNRINLNIWRRSDQQIIKTINLPLATYRFINDDHKLINLYDQAHEILYLLDPLAEIRPLRDSISNVNKTVWIDNNKMLYANDFEIWLYDLNSQNKTLLTRISQRIMGIIWYPNNNYVFYNTETSIATIELDKRDRYNITKLLELDNIKDLHLNESGDTLYFYAQIGRQKGIYKLPIQ